MEDVKIKLVIDNTSHITSFAVVGGLEGSIDYEGTVPDDFLYSTTPQAYRFIDGAIKLDPNYVSTPVIDENVPSPLEQTVADLMMMSANQQKQFDEENATNAQLILQVAELTAKQTQGGTN